jgi:hypothetical protein
MPVLRFHLLASAGLIAMGSPAAAATISAPAVAYCNEGGVAKIPVLSDVVATVSLPFSYRTTSGTAVALEDFQSIAGSQSIRKRSKSYTLTVSCTPDDARFEGEEEFTFSITSRSTSLLLGNAITRVILKENDPAPPPPPAKASLTIEEGACTEGDVCRGIVRRDGGDLSSPATFGYFTAATDSAKAGIDFSARSGTLTIPAGATTNSFTFPSIENSIVNGARVVQMRISSPDTPIAVAANDMKLVDDDSVITEPAPIEPDPDPAPPPVVDPVPGPSPEPTGGWVLSPTPVGKLPINDTPGDLVPTGIPNSAAPDVVGAFRFICSVAWVKRMDSLVHHGKVDVGHWHQGYGQVDAKPDDTYETMATKPSRSSCAKPSLDPGNDSQYWTSAWMLSVPAGTLVPEYARAVLAEVDPTAMDAEFKLTKATEMHWFADHFQNYYKRRPASDPLCGESVSVWGPKILGCRPVPNGLNMIFGFDMANMKQTVRKAKYRCMGGGNDAEFLRAADALAICSAAWDRGVRTLQFHAKLVGFECWDPRYIDSPNHQDHMAYSEQRLGYGKGGCMAPGNGATELVVIPQLTLLQTYGYNEIVHAAVKADPQWGAQLDSDKHWRQVDPVNAFAGGSMHADFRERWVPSVKAKWEDNCINKMLNCSAGVLGNGQALAGGTAPFYFSINRTSWKMPTPNMPVRPQGYDGNW